jgi:hypothetical protein
LDELLWHVQPIGDVSSPAAYQFLLDTLDPQQVQTAAGEDESFPVLAGDRPTIPADVRALEMDCFRPICLVIRMTRAR